MEEQQSLGYIIIAVSVTLVSIGIAFVLFIVAQKRRQHALETINEILEKQNNEEIKSNREEIQKLKDEVTLLKSKSNDQPKSLENPETGVAKS